MFVQPFDGSVTVTEYVAGVETVFVVVVLPPPQLKVAPPVVEDAVKFSFNVVQVKTTGAAMLAFGAVMFWGTVAEAVAVQPLAGLVIVTV